MSSDDERGSIQNSPAHDEETRINDQDDSAGQQDNNNNDNNNDPDEMEDYVDEDEGEEEEYEDDEDQILSMGRHKKSSSEPRQNDYHVSDSHNNDNATGGSRKDRGLREEGDRYTIDDDSSATKKREMLEKRLDEAIKSGNSRRRKKNGDIDLEQMQDAQIQGLKNQMQEVAFEDARCIDEKSGVAMNKLKLLPKVKEVLLRKNLADSILDNNLLESVRVWLEPLPDGSLPAYEIQKVIFSSLLELPIKTIHLRESGLGKVVLFYQKSKRVEPGLKRIADKLVGNWTRPILNLSDNYHDKIIQQESFDIDRLIEARKRKVGDTANLDRTTYEENAARRKRAAAPQPRATAYKVAPKVNMAREMTSAQRMAAAGIGASLSRDDQYRRLNGKMLNRGGKRSAKKSGVSIEGRNLPL
ncbi:Spn1 protein [Saccharomycopsis crataegensis]|uniref:Spn1 protein n=1 Tax=Saccharomycopsis crataegensis TaxID=43959 RepID=A0AAV5QMG4_9ASCO|nr:Spn1 protein [Saccharomycopsis crataegensis]